jgi:flagellar biosynthesis protein FlhF
MKVQTYKGTTVKDALKQVREAHGPDAVILETRQKDDGRRTWTEVSVAPSNTDLSKVKPLFSNPKPVGGRYGASAYARQQDGEPLSTAAANEQRRQVLDSGEAIDGELKALRREISRVTTLHTPKVDPVDQALRTFGRSFERGLEETRDLLRALLSETRAQSTMDFSPSQARLYNLLTHNGVEDLLAEELVRGLDAQGEGDNPLDLRRQLAERLLSKVVTAAPLATRRGRQVVGFFGPTGVGKTTTIAKVAADASIRYGRKVGLITTDTYRIAAVEQLAAYAEILDLTIEVARDRDELAKKLKTMKRCDMVLVDSAGRNPKDDSAVAEMADAISPDLVPTRLLCTAAGTNPRTLAEVLRAFKPVGVSELVITKMDECVGHGSMLNAHLRTGYPLTYFTTGQRVPEDIEAASAERLVRLVLEQWVV